MEKHIRCTLKVPNTYDFNSYLRQAVKWEGEVNFRSEKIMEYII